MVKAICPKCGKEGTQVIFSDPTKDRKDPSAKYLRFHHPDGTRHYIGKVRTLDEAMGQFNKPETIHEYKEMTEEIVSELKQLISRYSTSDIGSVKLIVRRLKGILTRYGY